MKLRVKDVDLSTGGPFIAVLNEEDARKLDLHAIDRIKITREGDINNQEKWNEYFEWFKENAENLHKVFPKYLKKLKDKRTVRI